MKLAPLKVGAFGTGNLGDDLMLQAILKDEPEAHVVAYGPPCLPFDVRYIPAQEFIANAERYLSMATSLDFGGGNLFWSLENLSDMLILSQQAKLAGLSVRLNRVGLQGYERNRTYAKMLLRLADSVSVRDRESVQIARQLGRDDCDYVRDYAFELLDARDGGAVLERPPRRVGINFSDVAFTSNDPSHADFIRHISGIFSEIARQFKGALDFVYIPFSNHRFHRVESDLRAGAILWEASDGLIQYAEGVYTTDDLVEQVRSVDILLGKRFHMQVVGHGLGKAVIPLVYDTLEQSKFAAMARDNNVETIPYVGFSQGFIISQIKRRLNQLLAQSSLGNENESSQGN